MDTLSIRFARDLTAKLREKVLPIRNSVVTGACEDLATYKWMAGQILAYGIVMSMIEELAGEDAEPLREIYQGKAKNG